MSKFSEIAVGYLRWISVVVRVRLEGWSRRYYYFNRESVAVAKEMCARMVLKSRDTFLADTMEVLSVD